MADEEVKNVEPVQPAEPVVQSIPQPELPKEERVVEIPIDINLFKHSIGAALAMLERARKLLEGSVAYERFVGELANLGGSLQDIGSRVVELNELDSVLLSTQFTSKSEVDAKIRKCVIEKLSQHFKFVKIDDNVANADDLVVFDVRSTNSPQPVINSIPYGHTSLTAQPTQLAVEKTGSSRDLNAAASRDKIRRQARAEAMQEAGLPANKVASAYEAIFEKDNAVVQEELPIVEGEDQISPEEAARIFGDSAVDPKVEALKSRILPKKLKSGPAEQRGANKGIARSK